MLWPQEKAATVSPSADSRQFEFSSKAAADAGVASAAAVADVDIFFISETSEEENSQPIRKLFISK